MSWIRRASERRRSTTENAQGGPGRMLSAWMTDTDEELAGKGRLFKENVLEKDCGVGYHLHDGDCELYLILEGEAEYDDNGTKTVLRAGDVTFTGNGEGHAITNRSETPVRFIALILYS